MPKNKYKRETLYTVIFFYIEGTVKGHKLHNIEADKDPAWNRTVEYIRELHPTVTHANLYGGITRTFKRQINLKNEQP